MKCPQCGYESTDMDAARSLSDWVVTETDQLARNIFLTKEAERALTYMELLSNGDDYDEQL